MNAINARVDGADNQGWLNKKGIAERYSISERQVDYLREKRVLPFYVVPSRCIRFDPKECDAVMKRFRRNWDGDDGEGKQ